MKLVSIISLLIILAGCGGGGGGTGPATPAAVTFNLTCDMMAVYTPTAAPVSTTGTGTLNNTTVIALHGKNGRPTHDHMTTLATDLNAQGYNVVMPYMPWNGFNWDGTLCEGLSYINSLITTEKNAGRSVILLGHSLGGPIVLSYAALANSTKPDALVVLAPGHFIHLSSILASAHAPSIQTAKNMVAAGNGTDIATFATYNLGANVSISAPANVYLSYHDTAQFPNIRSTIPIITVPMLWLAGATDSLTAIADGTFGLPALIPATPVANDYRVITGDHFTVTGSVTAALDPWFAGL